MDQAHCTSSHTLLDKTKAYLDRSKIVPIAICVAFCYVNSDLKDDTVSYTELIRPHMAHCLHLFVNAYHCKDLFAQLDLLADLRGSFLQSLDMRCSKFLESFEVHSLSNGMSGIVLLLAALRVYETTLSRRLPLHILQAITVF